jgi:hypothetical protein
MSLGEVMLRSQRGKLKDAFATDAVTTSFTALNEQAAAPSGDGVHHIDPRNSGYVSAQMKVLPFGTDAANETFDGKIIAWNKNQEADAWVPTELLTFACIIGTGSMVRAGSHTFVDTITHTSGIASADVQIVSTADNTRAWLVVDIMGAEYIQFQADLGTAAAANFYFHLL